MRYSLAWLRDYVDIPDRQMLIDRLTRAGSEVERVIDQGVDFEGVIVALVDALRPHPNADKLQLALLSTGGTAVEVVTGATNLAVGDRVPLAVTGARLKDRRIERQVFRGIPSEGMLCSAIELGVGEDAAGILILDPSAVPGEDVRQLFPADTILEVEIKSNRPDLLCHVGIAREISALVRVPLRPPSASATTALPAEPLVRLEYARACRRFVARRFTGIKVAPSPVWLQARLRAAGVRPISNVVDITNYVMLELGQPMHAFDQRRLDGALVVRQARAGETLSCLDGKTRELRPEDIVVADGSRARALAGIIGGTDTAVDATTTEIVLEAATWEPRQIRASSRAHGVRSEASSRFEKGLSPAISAAAIERATALIAELAGGKAVGHNDVYPDPLVPVSIELSAARIDRVLGIAIPLEEAAAILERLAFAVRLTGDQLTATPPDFRLDCTIPEDLVEEVGRIYGYDRVPSTLPGQRMPVRDLYQRQDVDEIARDLLVGLAFDEALTNSLVSEKTTADIRLPAAPAARARLRNPMVENRDALRASLLPGLLEALALNARQDQPGARLIELGTVFWKGEEGVDEPRVLGLGVHVTGGVEPALAGLREVQQALAVLRDRVSMPPVTFRPAKGPGWHPGRTAEIHDENGLVGMVGEVHPSVLVALGLPGRAVAAEVLFDRFVDLGGRTPTARPLPRFPGIRRDITVVIRGQVAAGELAQVMQRVGGYTLREISMLSEYQGLQVGAGARSLSFRLQFQADDRTLTSEEVSATYQRIVDGLKQEFDAEVRA
ncbi:MAG: phenylalanine--tRNA ligase subunit beta [Candidatus Dormibacteraeota bacterium]|nr:phenylalanine--tRNA ligase subunit beta [Candidatus Dormibacteraeota bacterium]